MLVDEKPEVWRSAMDLAAELHKRTASFSGEEKEGVAAQIREAAVQVPTNIMLAAESDYTSDVLHYLSQSRWALRELDTFLIVAQDLTHLDEAESSTMRQTVENIRTEMARHFKIADN